MGWAYYEISGGADFAPEQREVIVAETETSPTPEVVTRAATPTLLSVSTSNVTPAPEAENAVLVSAPAPVEPAPVVAEPAPEVIEVVAPMIEDPVDIREVASSRVNMRAGPGTNFDVIVTLDGGTEIEVLDVNASGWANVATVDRGIEGWMAERLLTSPDA